MPEYAHPFGGTDTLRLRHPGQDMSRTGGGTAFLHRKTHITISNLNVMTGILCDGPKNGKGITVKWEKKNGNYRCGLYIRCLQR